MGITIKHFDKNKLKDLLDCISYDIDEDDMKWLKEFIKDFKVDIKSLRRENKILKTALKFYSDNNKIRATKDKFLNDVALKAFEQIEANIL